MAFSIEIDSARGWVEVRSRGVVTFAEITESRRQSAILLARHALSRVLVDNREADFSEISVTEALKFSSSHHLAFSVVPNVRLAVLSRFGHLQAANLSEAVARKHGVNMRVFLDADETRRWLAES